MARGGRRPGAGAPKGNKNALRNGRSMSNERLKVAWESLTPEQRDLWLPIVKRAGAAFDVSWIEEVAAAEAGLRLIVPPRAEDPSTHTYTHTDNQTIKDQHLLRERELDVVKALMAWGFFGAQAFVEVHGPALQVLEKAIAEMTATGEDAPEQLVGMNRAAMIRNAVHEALMVRVGNVRQCPYCGRKQAIMVRLLDEAERQERGKA